jgi:GNAT superfamily N-acetyltransferase
MLLVIEGCVYFWMSHNGIMLELSFRKADEADLPALVTLFADDPLGAQREDLSMPLNSAYGAAFAAIESDPNNEVMVIESEGELVGTIQLTFLANLTHKGAWRCQVEGVRIHSDYRGRGVGTRFLEWAIARAEERGCSMMQLTSDKQRLEAIAFYEKLGFRATHEGFKRML